MKPKSQMLLKALSISLLITANYASQNFNELVDSTSAGGECRQSNGAYPLKFSRGYSDLSPHTEGSNAEEARNRCKDLCLQFDWCYAAQVIFQWDTPECQIVTDRPTYENVYGPMTDEELSWGYMATIENEQYQTYCNGGNPLCLTTNDYGSNWDGGSLYVREGYECWIKETVIPTPAPVVNPAQSETFYELVDSTTAGGECRQSDGAYPLKFSTSYHDLNPHTNGTNAEQARTRCKELCLQFSWCYAAEVVVRDIWPTPECRLVTDRPTYENVYGTNQIYAWGYSATIDNKQYQTYCAGGNPECSPNNDLATNWNGGSLNVREGYECWIKDGSNPQPETPTPIEPEPTKDTFPNFYELVDLTWGTPAGGECRQSDGAYPLTFSTGFSDLTPHTDGTNAKEARNRCTELCLQFDWCYAAQVVVRDIWPTPNCDIITDRPTYENVYGPMTDVELSWGYMATIDNQQYQTYCAGGNPECSTSNDLGTDWDGGSLSVRAGYECWIKNISNLQPETTIIETTIIETTIIEMESTLISECNVFGFEPESAEEFICDICFSDKKHIGIKGRCVAFSNNGKIDLREFIAEEASCMLDYCAERNDALVNCNIQEISLKENWKTLDCGCVMLECGVQIYGNGIETFKAFLTFWVVVVAWIVL